jgi:nitrogen regulatory protein P-II 2
MQLLELQRITIISERFLKDEIIDLIKSKGAKGYTITDAEGEGSRGIRASEWEGKNIKLETIVSEITANKIINAISELYFESYAVIIYSNIVHVVRGEKYI